MAFLFRTRQVHSISCYGDDRARLAVDCVRFSSVPVGVLHVSILSGADLVHSDTFGENDAKATLEVQV